MTQDYVNTLPIGTIVRALSDLDPEGANVKQDMTGIIFALADAHGDGCGPMVRWSNGGACNVYDSWVKKVLS